MRVVFVTHNYPRHPGDTAGVFLHPLAVALADRGHDLRVIAPSDGGRGGDDVQDGIRVTRVRYASPSREHYAYTGRMQEALRSPAGWWAMFRMVGALRAATRAAAAGADQAVVHAHWWFPAGTAAPRELPTVVTLHGTDARLLDWPGARFLASRAFGPGRVITAVSRHVVTVVAQRLGSVIPSDRVSPMPLTIGERLSEGGAGLVFVGRLTAQKRIRLALDAHAELLRTRPELRLTIVGDGPERAALEAHVRSLGTGERVRFLGQVGPDEVTRALGDADAFVFPARHEGFGLAPAEAVVAGVPVVVCSDGGGATDILDVPGAGVLAEPTATAVAAALEGLLSDRAARGAAAAAGRIWRDRLSPATVAEQCERWYHEALGG